MSALYFDTSALLKFYVAEMGTPWVTHILTNPTVPLVFTSQLTIIEATCAFARRLHDGTLTSNDHARLLALFNQDVIYRYNIIDVMPVIIDTACQLANQHRLRAYDAVQLATGWLIQQQLQQVGKPPLTFVSADNHLLAIAQAENLVTDNPNNYP